MKDSIIENYSRSIKSFDSTQLNYIVTRAKEVSYLNYFEDRLKNHMKENLPELLFPELIENIRTPAQTIFSSLDAVITASCMSHENELKDACEKLEKINKSLLQEKTNILNILKPLRSLPQDDDMIHVLERATDEIDILAKKYNEKLKFQLSSLVSSLDSAISKPLNRLLNFVMDEFLDGTTQDAYIESVGVSNLLKYIENIKRGPYQKIYENGGELSGEESNIVYNQLKDFATELSKVANELIKQESKQQCKRIENIFENCQKEIIKLLNGNALNLIKSTGNSFQGLRYVFDHPIYFYSLSLPGLKFEIRPERWQKQWIDYEDQNKIVQERKWYTLWLYKHESKIVEKVAVEKSSNGYKFESFSSILRSFSQSANKNDLEDTFRNWLQEALNNFDKSLNTGLENGVNEYRKYLTQRQEELERDAKSKINNIESYREKLNQYEKLINKASDWRKLKLGEY